jgi:hypothetical protein
MSLADIFNDTIEIYRYTSILYSGDIEDVEIPVNPADDALIRVTLDSAQTGSIYLSGSTTETLSFDNSDHAESRFLFTALSGITPSGLSGGITIEAYNEAGEPVLNLTHIEDAIGHFAPKDNSQCLLPAGMGRKFNAMLFVGEDVNIITGDIVKVDREEGEFTVNKCVTVHGLGTQSHKEIILT